MTVVQPPKRFVGQFRDPVLAERLGGDRCVGEGGHATEDVLTGGRDYGATVNAAHANDAIPPSQIGVTAT